MQQVSSLILPSDSRAGAQTKDKELVKRSSALKELDDDGADLFRSSYRSVVDIHAANLSSKKGGGSILRGSIAISQQEPTIVVDVREFRSSLPSMLHAANLTILPVTLEVGDYILSPLLCVERKSIPDLIGSFGSGRLFKQMEQMCRFYSLPALLIEFDQHRPFRLLALHEFSEEISSRSLMSKLVLLALHFPRARLIWSRSSVHTVKLFQILKFEV